ncbi:hypothetical protein BOTCAL_0244g00030 [Botryotinia calthae]|uniref:Uncharacterized protein n=1 Tax=Botryotinia calthae TaxID=38488 RepID=A0A4Y8CZ60_9HELO|nr:hypothetical protein BOTCAL_0244g00030 [Botryotinia calthae]
MWYMRKALDITDKIRILLAALLSSLIIQRKRNNQTIGENALDLELIHITEALAQRAGVTYTGLSVKRWLFCKGSLDALTQDLDENTCFWAKDTVEYTSELDSMQCRGITEENKAGGENAENAEKSKPSKDNGISRGNSEDVNEVFDDKHCEKSLFLRSASLHLEKKIQFVMNDVSMKSPLTKKTN